MVDADVAALGSAAARSAAPADEGAVQVCSRASLECPRCRAAPQLSQALRDRGLPRPRPRELIARHGTASRPESAGLSADGEEHRKPLGGGDERRGAARLRSPARRRARSSGVGAGNRGDDLLAHAARRARLRDRSLPDRGLVVGDGLGRGHAAARPEDEHDARLEPAPPRRAAHERPGAALRGRNSFDGIFSSGSIEHFGDLDSIRQSVEEMYRVLRPGGGRRDLRPSSAWRDPRQDCPAPSSSTRPSCARCSWKGLNWQLASPLDFSISDETMEAPVDFDSLFEVLDGGPSIARPNQGPTREGAAAAGNSASAHAVSAHRAPQRRAPVDERARDADQARRLSAPTGANEGCGRPAWTSASIPAVPDHKQDIAVGGPLLERVQRRVILLLIQLVRFPFRILGLPLRQLRDEVKSLRAAAVESLAYVGVELRRLGDLVEQGARKGPPEETALAGLDLSGPVLVVGSRGQQGRCLAHLARLRRDPGERAGGLGCGRAAFRGRALHAGGHSARRRRAAADRGSALPRTECW